MSLEPGTEIQLTAADYAVFGVVLGISSLLAYFLPLKIKTQQKDLKNTC